MWVASRYDGFDTSQLAGNLNSKSGDTFIDRVSRGQLRTGLLLQTISLLLLIVSHYFYEGTGLFSWDMRNTHTSMRLNDDYRKSIFLFTGLYQLGTFFLLSFSSLLADDCAWSRGYRAGSKCLGYAVLFDMIAATLQTGSMLNFYLNYNEAWWTHYRDGSLDWIFGASARTIHAIGFALYGIAFFLLEVYHDEGTNDWHGTLNLFIFCFAAATEFLVLACGDPSVGIVVGFVALLSALFWSMAFEEEVNASTPKLSQSELCNELEEDVDRYISASQKAGPEESTFA